jgi:zinc transport system substrate-binding protein
MISRIVLILSVALFVSACGANSSSDSPRTVVAAFYPLAYAAEKVGDGTVSVDNLTPPGAEPHDLELTPKTVARIVRADVVLYLGHNFQPAVTTAVEQAKGETVDVLSGLPVKADDPHLWLDPILYARIVARIGGVLQERTRAAALGSDLRALDREYRSGLRNCTRHEIVTSHEAFGYLAKRYGLEQVAITGITPEAEPTPQDLERVVKTVRKTHATTVFFETLVSPRLARTVAREVGARTAVLDPIEGLTPAEQSRGENYLSVMRRNLSALRQALGCH